LSPAAPAYSALPDVKPVAKLDTTDVSRLLNSSLSHTISNTSSLSPHQSRLSLPTLAKPVHSHFGTQALQPSSMALQVLMKSLVSSTPVINLCLLLSQHTTTNQTPVLTPIYTQ